MNHFARNNDSGDCLPRAWVFAGGEFDAHLLEGLSPASNDHVICVDSGLAHCLAAGFTATRLIGDFDSVSPETLSGEIVSEVPRECYPSDKAASDLELALIRLCEEKLSQVVVLGVSGGRTDHMLFNWALPALRRWPFRLILLDDTVVCHVLQGPDQCALTGAVGQTLSLLPVSKTAGVTTSGLRYALSDAVLDVGSTLGLSNVLNQREFGVSISTGVLLVMQERRQYNSAIPGNHSDD